MRRYSSELIQKIQALRAQGKTFSEIRSILQTKIPKGSLSFIVKNVKLPRYYYKKVKKLNYQHLFKARVKALEINRKKRKEFLKHLDTINGSISKKIHNSSSAKIALSMLCLAEASKSKTQSECFTLGNSDPRIIKMFLILLQKCFDFQLTKVRCTVQCRADQDIQSLEKYWQDITGVPKKLFYKSRIDPRTVGKPTKKKGYMGVLRIDYLDKKVQLELESLAQLVYNQLDIRARSLAG